MKGTNMKIIDINRRNENLIIEVSQKEYSKIIVALEKAYPPILIAPKKVNEDNFMVFKDGMLVEGVDGTNNKR